MKFLFFLPLSLLMGCLLIEAVLENNKLLEPPPPPSLLNLHYSDLLAKLEPFLLLRKWPLISCISMCKVGPAEEQNLLGWAAGRRRNLCCPSPVADVFDSQGISMWGQEIPFPRWKRLQQWTSNSPPPHPRPPPPQVSGGSYMTQVRISLP